MRLLTASERAHWSMLHQQRTRAGVDRMSHLKLHVEDPAEASDSYMFPNLRAKRWQPRLAIDPVNDPVDSIRHAELALANVEAKMAALVGQIEEDFTDDDRPRAA